MVPHTGVTACEAPTSSRTSAGDLRDATGFAAWYHRHHAEIIGVLALAGGDADLAADAADEAFARAWASWGRVQAMASPTGWTYRVALNVLRRRMRRVSHERRLLEAGTPRLPVPAGAPVEVWTVVATLPERQRVAVALRYLADLPEAEVGRAMGISAGTVGSTLSAARRRLARCFEEDHDD